MIDAHVHLDRAWTAEDRYVEHERLSIRELMGLPLGLKQRAVGKLHGGLAFEPEAMRKRMERVIRAKIRAGETEVWACIDTTPDIGLSAFDTTLELAAQYADKITIMVGAYPVFGFKERGSERYNIIHEAAKRAQFLVGLPERDVAEGHPIGFRGHLRTLFELGQEFSLPIHVHLDQANSPIESGTETLIEAARWFGSDMSVGKGTMIWAVHAISPSSYPDDRFRRLLDGLTENNIGVIVCPHAAISMRQLRPYLSPTHNCIARVREMLAAGIPVRLGTDNIGDLFVGLRRPELLREIEMIQSAVRLYDDVLWRKIACGQPLDDVDLHTIRTSLEEDEEVFRALP